MIKLDQFDMIKPFNERAAQIMKIVKAKINLQFFKINLSIKKKSNEC